MNHYLIVFGGAFIGLIGIILVFKYCLGPLLELLNRRPHENVQPVPQRISAKKSRFRPEIERFVHEEFESANHDVVFVAMSNLKLSIGIAVFMQERKVEYFLEKFPPKDSLVDSDSMLKLRSGLAALSFWGVQFTLGDRVHMLSDYRTFVEMANSNGNIIKEKITEFEDRYDFKLLCHWTDNYICDMAANNELWEGLISSGQKLLESPNASDYDIWFDFPCEEWERTRKNVSVNHFHQIPHTGEISADSDEDENKPLIDIDD